MLAAHLQVLLDQLEVERQEMASAAVAQTDPRFRSFEDEWSYALAVVNAVADTTNKHGCD